MGRLAYWRAACLALPVLIDGPMGLLGRSVAILRTPRWLDGTLLTDGRDEAGMQKPPSAPFTHKSVLSSSFLPQRPPLHFHFHFHSRQSPCT